MATNLRQDVINLKVIINGDQAGKEVKAMRNEVRDLTKALDHLTVGTDEYNQAVKELAASTARYNAHRKAVRDAVAEIEGGTKKVNPFIDALKKGAVAALGFFSTQQIIQWGKQIVSWAVRGTVALEDMRDKSAAVFRDSIDIVEDFAAINAQQLGVTEEKYVSLASQIGALLVPMGFAREEAAQMSSEALNLSAALSEWSNGNLTVEQTQEILGKALQGQLKGLKQLGISITDTDIKTRLAAEGNDKLTGSALKRAKAEATLQLINEQSADAQREYAASAEDAGRAQGRIVAFIEQQKEKMLSGLLPAYKAITNAIANFLSPLKRQSDQHRELQAQFNVQIETLKRGDLSYENRVKLIGQINEKYKDYLPNLLTEESSLTEIEAAQLAVNEQFEKKIILLAAEEALVDINRKQIKATQEELELQIQLTEATEKFNKEIEKAGATRDASGVFIKNEQFAAAFEKQSAIRAANEAQRIQDRVDNNKKEQESLRAQYALTRDAAIKLGLDIDSILNPPTFTPAGDDPDPSKKTAEQKRFEAASAEIEKLKNQRIAANERVVQSDEQAAIKRQIIELDAARETEQVRLEIFSNAKKEEEKLTEAAQQKLTRDILDLEIKRHELESQLSLQERTELIEQERALRIEALDEEALAAEAHARRLEIIHREADIKLSQAKLATIDQLSDEYAKLQTEIAAKQRELDRLVVADQFATTQEIIELSRELTLAGIAQLKLDEEDLQKYRERINLEYDKKILQARLKTLTAGSAEFEKVRNAIDEIDRRLAQDASLHFLVDTPEGPSSSQEDGEKRRERIQEAADIALNTTQQLADNLLQTEENRLNKQLQLELANIDRIAEARRNAAGDDAVLLAKIDAQARAERERAEKKAAKERQKLARKEAIIQGALGIIEAIPDIGAQIAAGLSLALQLAVIDSQSFFYGGPTGSRGLYRDRSGHQVAGVVHTDEYVVPRTITQDPQYTPVINYLERVRRAKGGYEQGGLATVSTTPVPYVQTVTSSGASDIEHRMLQALEDIRMITAAWPTVIKAVMAYTDFEKTRDTVEEIRGKSRA